MTVCAGPNNDRIYQLDAWCGVVVPVAWHMADAEGSDAEGPVAADLEPQEADVAHGPSSRTLGTCGPQQHRAHSGNLRPLIHRLAAHVRLRL